jgi:hypothetical protein
MKRYIRADFLWVFSSRQLTD